MEGWGSASVASGVCPITTPLPSSSDPFEPDHDDLHTRIEPRRLSCAESGRHALGKGTTPTLGAGEVQIGLLILGSGALLDMTPGDLWLGQSQQLALQGLELGCLGADRR